MAIIRIARENFRLLWAAVTFVVSIAGYNAMMRVVHVGGTIRSCHKHAAMYELGELQSEISAQRL